MEDNFMMAYRSFSFDDNELVESREYVSADNDQEEDVSDGINLFLHALPDLLNLQDFANPIQCRFSGGSWLPASGTSPPTHDFKYV
jgi:hypothetical protein